MKRVRDTNWALLTNKIPNLRERLHTEVTTYDGIAAEFFCRTHIKPGSTEVLLWGRILGSNINSW